MPTAAPSSVFTSPAAPSVAAAAAAATSAVASSPASLRPGYNMHTTLSLLKPTAQWHCNNNNNNDRLTAFDPGQLG